MQRLRNQTALPRVCHSEGNGQAGAATLIMSMSVCCIPSVIAGHGTHGEGMRKNSVAYAAGSGDTGAPAAANGHAAAPSDRQLPAARVRVAAAAALGAAAVRDPAYANPVSPV